MFNRTTPANFIAPRPERNRRNAKQAKKDSMSFRPKGEILLRSLAFARDDGPRRVTSRLCAFAGDMVFPISTSFPNFKYFWLDFAQEFPCCPDDLVLARQINFLKDGAGGDRSEGRGGAQGRGVGAGKGLLFA